MFANIPFVLCKLLVVDEYGADICDKHAFFMFLVQVQTRLEY